MSEPTTNPAGEPVALFVGEPTLYALITPAQRAATAPNPLELPAALREALFSLQSALAGSAVDPGSFSAYAWAYAIVCGWEPENLAQVADYHEWSASEIDALARHRQLLALALGEQECPAADPEPLTREKAARLLAEHSPSPRYKGPGGDRILLEHPGLIEHAYRSAQAAGAGQGPDLLAALAAARAVLLEGQEG